MIPIAVFTRIDAGTASTSAFQRTLKIVHDHAGIRVHVRLESAFTMRWKPRSRSTGICTRIKTALRQAADRLKKRGFQTHARAANVGETKLLVRSGRIEIKVEVNFVMRGTVQPVRRASLTPVARDMLMADLDIPVVSLEDMYGGKLVAALDRQHPRDLFDVMQLFAHEGITSGIRRAFVVYLASSNRPVHEVLFPVMRDIRHDYEHNFQGMTAEPVPLDALLAARERVVRELHRGLDDNERRFLLSLVRGTPDWPMLGIAHLEYLPSIRWKLHNLAQLQKTNATKFTEQANTLTARLAEISV